MSLYDIETGADCRKKMDELLVMVDTAEEALKTDTPTAKRAIRSLKSHLKELFRKSTRANEACMSVVEAEHFRPAIRRAYISVPKLSAPKSGSDGLHQVRKNLRYADLRAGAHESEGAGLREPSSREP